MDQDTIDHLVSAGWYHYVGRDGNGRPYAAFTRGLEYFHVTLANGPIGAVLESRKEKGGRRR